MPYIHQVRAEEISIGHGKVWTASCVGQGLSLDWGFVTAPHNKQVDSLTGINGETAFLVVTDHIFYDVFGFAAESKAPPIDWLEKRLVPLNPSTERGRYACMDLGRELGRNPKIQALLKKYKYSIRPTAPDSSNQNYLGERPMQKIGAGM